MVDVVSRLRAAIELAIRTDQLQHGPDGTEAVLQALGEVTACFASVRNLVLSDRDELVLRAIRQMTAAGEIAYGPALAEKTGLTDAEVEAARARLLDLGFIGQVLQ